MVSEQSSRNCQCDETQTQYAFLQCHLTPLQRLNGIDPDNNKTFTGRNKTFTGRVLYLRSFPATTILWKRILIIEGDRATRKALKPLIKPAGYSVETAGN